MDDQPDKPIGRGDDQPVKREDAEDVKERGESERLSGSDTTGSRVEN